MKGRSLEARGTYRGTTASPSRSLAIMASFQLSVSYKTSRTSASLSQQDRQVKVPPSAAAIELPRSAGIPAPQHVRHSPLDAETPATPLCQSDEAWAARGKVVAWCQRQIRVLARKFPGGAGPRKAVAGRSEEGAPRRVRPGHCTSVRRTSEKMPE